VSARWLFPAHCAVRMLVGIDVGAVFFGAVFVEHVKVVEGVFTYRVDRDGRLVALRAFWEFDAMTFEVPM